MVSNTIDRKVVRVRFPLRARVLRGCGAELAIAPEARWLLVKHGGHRAPAVTALQPASQAEEAVTRTPSSPEPPVAA